MMRVEFDFRNHFNPTTGLHAAKDEVSALRAMADVVEKVLAPAAEQVKKWWEGKVEQLTFKVGRVGNSYVTSVEVEIKIDSSRTLTSSMRLNDVDVREGRITMADATINLLKCCSDHFLDELAKQKLKKK